MLNYSFKAKNTEGRLIAGSMQADRSESVITALKQKGYYLLSVESENRFLAAVRRKASLLNRLTVRDRAIFTHQLATLLRAGVRLSIALKTLSNQTRNKYLALVVTQLQADIEQSSSLSQAMARHPGVFSKVYTAIVEASEESGSLAETLSVLSKQLKARASVNARVRAALTYPVFLLAVSAVVVTVLTSFVIPKFIKLFVDVNQALPLPTKILVGATNAVKDFWWAGLLILVVGALILLTALRDRRIRKLVDGWLLKVPVLGPLNRKLQLARFTRTLGSLLNGGVRIVAAINTTKGTTANRAFAAEIAQVEEAILKGVTLTRAIESQKYFTEVAANMIAVGEDTGTLPEMLLEVADMYDQECEAAIGSMTDLLGPVMIVLLGLIIGFVVLAILLPIFETSTMID